MAPADLSPPGSSSYSSDTLVVGDGTWDFTKNTFLLPNLAGLNFETMQYNGMGNRFSTVAQYHTLVLAHGVLAVISFLFLVPAAVFVARFYTGRPGYAIRFHAYLLVLAVGLTTVAFILGYFAVGPNRSLTNPHHGIGVAIYVLVLVQAIYGRLVKNIQGRSLRVTLHQWAGRAIALLAIAQVPLGLTLYGSPRYLFILYSIWMAFLVVLYFILSYRSEGRRDRREEYMMGGARSMGGTSRVTSDRTESKSGGGGMFKWLGPLAAGAGALALFNRKRSSSKSRATSRSRSRSRLSRSRSRGPEVMSSRHASDDFVEDEKYTESGRRTDVDGGGGMMKKVMGLGAALGAGALVAKLTGRKKDTRRDDAEYSAVSTETPSRYTKSSRPPPRRDGASTMVSGYTDYTTDYTESQPPVAAGAVAAGRPRPGGRPVTPPPSHRRTNSRPDDSFVESDYSSYRSPSRRTPAKSSSAGGGMGKGLLAGLGLGWFAKKMGDRRDKKEEERLRLEDEESRSGVRPARYTGDGYSGSPSTRRDSRRRPPAGRPAASQVSEFTESEIEPRPATGYSATTAPLSAPISGGGPLPPPAGAGGYHPSGLPTMTPAGVGHSRSSRSRSRSRHDTDYVSMPSMPSDPHGLLHESSSDGYGAAPRRRDSSRRRREGEAAAAAAVATASRLAVGEERRRQEQWARGETPGSPSQPVGVRVKVHNDNVTLRRVTDGDQRRHARSNSASSLSGTDSPGGGGGRQRYRRDSSQRRAEAAAERRAESSAPSSATAAPPPPPPQFGPLSPPNPAFAGGRTRPPGKDSAYYSGAAPGPPPSSAGGATSVGPSSMGGMAAAGNTVSSLGSPGSHGTWSGLSPSPSGALHDPTASAAERRRRRRLERRADARPSNVDFS